jgi:hypothetical protein
MRADHILELGDREGSQHEACDAACREGSIDLDRKFGDVVADRCQETDALVADETPEDEAKCIA